MDALTPPRAASLAAPPPRGSDAALRRAAQQFEAQAIGFLLQPVFATADLSRGPFGGGAAEAQWRPMLVDAYAAAASRSGAFGLADMVYRELVRSREAAENPEREGAGR